MKRFGYLLIMILLPVTVSVAGDSLQSVKSITDLSVFTDRYYLEPRPDLVDEAIEFIGNNNVLLSGNAAPMTVAFFAEVFSSNKDRLPKWQEVIQRQPDEVRPVFLRALSMSDNPKRVLEEPPSARLNDICWGGFLASGDSTYLQILLTQLDHIDERRNLNLYTTAATAKWSLASNALRHRAVKAFIKAARKDAAAPLRRELKEILTRNPGEIQSDMYSVLREQRRVSTFEANAIWVKGHRSVRI